jgi:hypothetical protein
MDGVLALTDKGMRAAGEVATFFPARPDVRAERILRIQGYKDLGRVRPAITRAAGDMACAAQKLAAPRVAWCEVSIRSLEAGVLALEGGTTLCCDAFDELLAGCTKVAPFVLSVGSPIGERVIELADRGDLLEAVLLETAGWLAIEDATRQFRSYLREAAHAGGRRITTRLGPGYTYRHGDAEVMWPLEQQIPLFALFGDAELPVTLHPSCAMNPKLSRSGFHGLAPRSTPTTVTRPGAPAHEEQQQ